MIRLKRSTGGARSIGKGLNSLFNGSRANPKALSVDAPILLEMDYKWKGKKVGGEDRGGEI